MRAGLLKVHRWLGLGLAVFWLAQALTGLLLVWRWELDGGPAVRAARPDFAAIERHLDLLAAARPGFEPTSIWTNGPVRDRYDVTLENPQTGESLVWRLDGQGRVIREGAGRMAAFDAVTSFHQTLLLGERGHWIIGLSGLLLATNILAGAVVAWPGGGRWRAAVAPRSGGPQVMWTHSWHRAAGLWLFAPALVVVLCGAAMSYEDPLRAALGGETTAPEAPPQAAPTGAAVGPAAAVNAALDRHPGGVISAVVYPYEGAPWYRIRLLQPDELRQAYGRTTLYVEPRSGRVLAEHDTTQTGWGARLMDSLHGVHTGQALGVVGRFVTLSVGLWLAAMVVLGVLLWNARRRQRSARGGRPRG